MGKILDINYDYSCEYSIGISSHNQACHNHNKKDYAFVSYPHLSDVVRLEKNDIVKVILNTANNTLDFIKNDKRRIMAFEGIDCTKQYNLAISLYSRGFGKMQLL